VSGFIPSAGYLFWYVTSQPSKANSAFHPSGVGKFTTQQNQRIMPLLYLGRFLRSRGWTCRGLQFRLYRLVPASAWKAKAGTVHSVSWWTRGVQVKLRGLLRTRAIPERLRRVHDKALYKFTFTLPYLTTILTINILQCLFQRMSASVSKIAPEVNDLTLREKRVYADDYRRRPRTAPQRTVDATCVSMLPVRMQMPSKHITSDATWSNLL